MGTNRCTSDIQSTHVRSWLQAIINLIWEDILGFTGDDIGLHYIQSGGAMSMFLPKASTIIMMRVGRWSSEAFLEYIREQVEDFTVEILENMIKFESFFNMNRNTAPQEVFTNNEDGPETVDFTVKISELALKEIDTTA